MIHSLKEVGTWRNLGTAPDAGHIPKVIERQENGKTEKFVIANRDGDRIFYEKVSN